MNAAEWKKAHLRLEGAGIVITRPVGSGASLARRVVADGGWPVLLPGLSLRGLATDTALGALVAVGRKHAAIFASPAAVRFAFALCPRLRVARGAAFALGAGTARALARHGIDAVVPDGRNDSEGLLALPELAKVRHRDVALIGAPGGRDLIAPALRRRGARVAVVSVYRRVPARLTRRHFEALAAVPDPLITLVSSGEALANIVARLPPRLLDRLQARMLVVSSARLARIARDTGFTEIAQARSALPEDLLAAAAATLARHRL